MEAFIDRLKGGEPESWLLAFALYALVVGLYSLLSYARIERWQQVTGELINANVADMTPSAVASERNYNAEVSYRYNINGTDYEGSRLSPFLIVATHNLKFLIRHQMKAIETVSGNRVRVFYNPRNPGKSYLIPPNPTGYFIIAGLTLIPMVAYVAYVL